MGWEVSVGWFWQQQIPAIFPRTYWLRYHAQLFSTIASVPDHARGFGKLEHLGLRKNPGVVHQYRSYREGCERKHMQDEISSIVPNDIDKHVTHHYADNNGVRIHYASIGKGPLIVMIHGFPDFWYTWRNQMVALAPLFQVVALDLRGYNLSDKPLGGEHYSIHHLVEDVQAVIRHLRRDKAIIIGHDWGGAIAWIFAIGLPALTERLIILNCPHPSCIIRELAHNPQQQEQSAYARDFQKEDAHKRLTPESLSAWVKDSAARERYLEAFRRSDFEAMLHYYKQNYPRPPYQEVTLPVKVQAPVLQIHGMQDPFLLPGRLERYLGVAGERLDLAHHSPSRSLCPTRCGRACHRHDGKLAYSLIDRHLMTRCATSNIRYQKPWIQKPLQTPVEDGRGQLA